MPAPGPDYPAGPGKQALREWAGACLEAGIAHHAIFGAGGHLVITWVADRNGDLLRLEFPSDSFRGWEVEPGVTLADCVVQRAQQAEVRWSRAGTAPLRFAPTAPPSSAPSGASPVP